MLQVLGLSAKAFYARNYPILFQKNENSAHLKKLQRRLSVRKQT